MGYRSRLGRVAKSDRERYMGKSYDACEITLEESYPDGDEGALYRPHFHEQFIELGKYCQFEIAPEPFYDGFDIGEECESEFHILSKYGLKQIIREYHENVATRYKELFEQLEDGQTGEVTNFLRSRMNEWSFERCDMYKNAEHPFDMSPYYLDSEPSQVTDGFIARSWQYEYQIFNLTYIYRTFDWENDYLIYSAW